MYQYESLPDAGVLRFWRKPDPSSAAHNHAAESVFAELRDNGYTEGHADEFSVAADDLLAVDPSDRYLLSLPEDYPYDVCVRVEGLVQQAGFRVYATCQIGGFAGEVLSAQRNGALLELSDGRAYLLSERQHALCSAVGSMEEPTENAYDGYARVARLQQLVGEHSVVNDQAVGSSPAGGISSDDGIELATAITGEPISLMEDVLVDHDGEQVHATDPGNPGFAADFERGRRVRSTYRGAGGGRIVVTPAVARILDTVKAWQREPTTRPSPAELLERGEELFVDPNVAAAGVPLAVRYSDRVIELGQYRPKFYPFISEHESTWVPGFELVGNRDERERITLGDHATLEKFERAIAEAIANDKVFVKYGGAEVPVHDAQLAARVAEKQLAQRDRALTREQLVEPGAPASAQPLVLIIHDNADTLGHAEGHELDPEDRPYEFQRIEGLATGFELLDHQVAGVAWLQTLAERGQRGAILGDDMGLGKTLQVLYTIEWHARRYPSAKPYLVVAPVSLLENWEQEYERFFPAKLLAARRLRAKDLGRDASHEAIAELARPQLLLTNYETLQRAQLTLCAVDYAMVVLDEAQQIKNPGTLKTTAAKALKADFRLAMTGTPVENTLTDLWSLADFANPGLLGTAKEFRKVYEAPASVSPEAAQTVGEDLRRTLGWFFKRRLKSQVAESLPQKLEHPIECPMPPVQREAYLGILLRKQDATAGYDALSTLQALRAVAEHPALYGQNIHAYTTPELIITSARLSETVKLLDDISQRGEKVILFAIFKTSQQMLVRVLKDRFGVSPHVINGDTPSSSGARSRAKLSRQQAIDDFAARPGFGAIVMSPVAAGVGLNVTAANHVIHFSRHWNPAKESQATDRAYRIGQRRDVHVYYPMATLPDCDSFDVVLDRLLRRKTELADGTLFPSAMAEVTRQEFESAIFAGDATHVAAESPLTLEDADRLDGYLFEALIGTIYRKRGLTVRLSPKQADRGADVVVVGDQPGDAMLVQAKAITSGKVTNGAVQEIVAALKPYGEYFRETFTPVVATNRQLTTGAHNLLRDNGGIAFERTELAAALRDFDILRSELETLDRDRFKWGT